MRRRIWQFSLPIHHDVLSDRARWPGGGWSYIFRTLNSIPFFPDKSRYHRIFTLSGLFRTCQAPDPAAEVDPIAHFGHFRSHLTTCSSVQIIPRPIVTGESIVAWDESFIPVSSPIGQVPQNITKKRFSQRNSCIFLTKWWPSLELGKPFACFENDIIGGKS